MSNETNSNNWPDRLYALDISRGLAALSVVLWHWQFMAYQAFSARADFVSEQQALYGLLKLLYEQGARAVDYFFLLSGFIFFWLYKESIQNRRTTAGAFFMQRFSRLYPLHVVTLLLVAFLQWLYKAREHTFFVFPFNDWYHFLLQLLMVSNWGLQSGPSFNSPGWSVSMEVLLYTIFFVLVFYRQGWWFLCLSVSILSFFLTIFIDYRFFSGFAMFFLGGVIFYATAFLSARKRIWKLLLYATTVMTWLLVLVSFYFIDLSGVFYAFGVAGIFGMIAFPNYFLFPLTLCSLALFELDHGPILKRMAWLGDITYSSYMIHFPLTMFFGLAMSYGIVPTDMYKSPLYLLLYLAILIPLSYLSFQWFERPIQNFLRSHMNGISVSRTLPNIKGKQLLE